MTSAAAIDQILQDQRAKLVLRSLVRTFRDSRRVVHSIARWTPAYVELHPELANVFSAAVGDETERTDDHRHFLVVYYDGEAKDAVLRVLSYAKGRAQPHFADLSHTVVLGYDLAHLSQLPFMAMRRVEVSAQ